MSGLETKDQQDAAAMAEAYGDVITMAVEGDGIGYWADVVSYWPEVCAGIRDRDTGVEYRIDHEAVRLGVDTVLGAGFEVNPEVASWMLPLKQHGDAGDIDAVAADVIVQAYCFGKLIYG